MNFVKKSGIMAILMVAPSAYAAETPKMVVKTVTATSPTKSKTRLTRVKAFIKANPIKTAAAIAAVATTLVLIIDKLYIMQIMHSRQQQHKAAEGLTTTPTVVSSDRGETIFITTSDDDKELVEDAAFGNLQQVRPALIDYIWQPIAKWLATIRPRPTTPALPVLSTNQLIEPAQPFVPNATYAAYLNQELQAPVPVMARTLPDGRTELLSQNLLGELQSTIINPYNQQTKQGANPLIAPTLGKLEKLQQPKQ